MIGINVVRGGLFKDNGVDWTLTKEEAYLSALAQILENKGLDYCFFTNGSTWDINTLKHFQRVYQIDRERVIFSETAREVVQSIAAFDAVIAIRMHALIISYGLGVPSINYVWNPKITELYRKIGYSQRAIRPENWSAEAAAQQAELLLKEESYRPDPELLMTLYRFLYETFSGVLTVGDHPVMYTYERVCDVLRNMAVSAAEDEVDLRTKLQRAQDRYYALFQSDDRKRLEIQVLQKKNAGLEQQLSEESKRRKKAEKERDEMKRELEQLYRTPLFRLYKKMGKTNRK